MNAFTAIPVALRRATSEDSGFIARLSAEAFTEYSRTPGAATAMVLRLFTLIACRGPEPVGFVALERLRSGGAVAVQALAVSEQHRGYGVGTRLLRAAEQLATAWGAREVRLHTAQANVAAFELFVKNGYGLERRIPRYYRGVFDACEMSKRL